MRGLCALGDIIKTASALVQAYSNSQGTEKAAVYPSSIGPDMAIASSTVFSCVSAGGGRSPAKPKEARVATTPGSERGSFSVVLPGVLRAPGRIIFGSALSVAVCPGAGAPVVVVVVVVMVVPSGCLIVVVVEEDMWMWVWMWVWMWMWGVKVEAEPEKWKIQYN